MRKSILFLFTLFVVAFQTSCDDDDDKIIGGGSIVKEIVEVPSFSKINLLGVAEIEIEKGPSLQVLVQDYENIVQYLEVKVQGNTLDIRTADDIILQNSLAKVYITMPDVRIAGITSSGSGNIILKSGINDIGSIKINGSGDLFSEAEEVAMTDHLTVDITGSGNVGLANVRCNTATCNIIGSGDITLSISRRLAVNIKGSGNIYYYGSDVEVETNISGSGKVVNL